MQTLTAPAVLDHSDAFKDKASPKYGKFLLYCAPPQHILVYIPLREIKRISETLHLLFQTINTL